jgi:hypothetical protein
MKIDRTPETEVWIHSASFTYRLDEPEQLFETIWTERPGWGFIRRADQWMKTSRSEKDLLSKGYVLRKPLSDEDVKVCKSCGMYLCSIPGWLENQHLSECMGSGTDQRKLEEMVLDEHRMKRFEEKIRERALKETLEREAEEKRERTERMRDEMLASQLAKDRKKTLKEEARDQLKNR